MTDSNTDVVIKSSPSVDFSLIYHPVLSALLNENFGVVRTYLALSLHGNGKATKDFRAVMLDTVRQGGTYAVSDEQFDGCILRLKELGILYVVNKQNKPDEYYLMPTCVNAPIKTITKEDQDRLRAAETTFDAEEVPDPWNTQPEPAKREPVASKPARQQNQNQQRPRQQLNTQWWRDNPETTAFLKELAEQWPKEQTQRVDWAQEAWQEVFGEEAGDDQLFNDIDMGVQWWLQFWLEENTPDQYITGLANFIRKEQWTPQAIEERQSKTRH